MFLSVRKTGSVEDRIQDVIDKRQDTSDDNLDGDNENVIETKIDHTEEGLPDDAEDYQGQESRRKKMGERLTSRRVRIK